MDTPYPAPGSTFKYEDGNPNIDMAVADGTPYVATQSPAGALTVWRPAAAGTSWIQLGGALNHVPLRGKRFIWRADHFSIATSGSTPWIAWAEPTPGGAFQVHVAKLAGSRFEELASGWPRGVESFDPYAPYPESWAGGFVPQLVVFRGRPYVATPRGDVARLSGASVEEVTGGLPAGCAAFLTKSGERLYASCGNEVFQLNDAGSAWEHVVTATDRAFVLDVTGTPYVAAGGIFRLRPDGQLEDTGSGTRYLDVWIGVGGPNESGGFTRSIAGFQGQLFRGQTGDAPYPDAQDPLALEALSGGAWQPIPSPDPPDESGTVDRLVESSDGSLWLMWDTANYLGGSPPRRVHVTRFAEEGAPFDFAPDPPASPPTGGQSPGGGQPGPGPVPNPGDGGYTDPDGTPLPHTGPPPLAMGACANPLLGTAEADRLVGTRAGDRIYGRGGADHLFGRASSDCLWGGANTDFLSGGSGNDALAGGPGDDRLVPGGGRDDVAAGGGDDYVNAAGGGPDRVNCGPGHDTARVSRNDAVKGCERVIVARG